MWWTPVILSLNNYQLSSTVQGQFPGSSIARSGKHAFSYRGLGTFLIPQLFELIKLMQMEINQLHTRSAVVVKVG